MQMSRNYLILLFMVGCFLHGLPARAEETKPVTPELQAQADELIAEAVENYGARRYEEAIELFRKAHDMAPEPELIYNIARSYEKLLKSEEAVEWYERFLEIPGTTGELRTRALKNIAALKQEIEAQKALQESDGGGSGGEAAPETTTDDTSAEADSTSDAPVSEALTPGDSVEPLSVGSESMTSSREMSKLRIASFVSMGVGVVGMVTGGIFGGLSIAAKKDFDSAENSADKIGYRDDVKRNALIFDVVFTSGAVITAAGVALFVVDAVRRDPEEVAANGRKMGAVKLMPSIGVSNDQVVGGLVGQF